MIDIFNVLEPNDDMDNESRLKDIYSVTENKHENREEENSYESLEQCFSEVKYDGNEKLYHMVKANFYLRRGQSKARAFHNAKEDYLEAIKLLRDFADTDIVYYEDLDLLLQLCIAKYFRNMGDCERRSNYSFALYELRKIEGYLDRKTTFNDLQSKVWLDMKINIGRIYKKSYEFENAENYFLEMFVCLKEKINFDITEDSALAEIQLPQKKDISDSKIYDLLQTDGSVYYNYFMQVLVQLIITYRKQRQYRRSMEICKQMLAYEALCVKGNEDDKKENIDILNNLGVCYRKTEQYKEAIETFEKVKKSNAQNRFANINYWKCIIDEGEEIEFHNKETRKTLECFLSENSSDLEVSFLRGQVLFREKEWKTAYDVFKAIYEKSPHLNKGSIALKAYYNMAKCLMAQDKYNQALILLEEILSACCDDILAKIDLGWCYMRLGEYDIAKQKYMEMENLKDTTVLETVELPLTTYSNYDACRFYNNLGECFLKTGDENSANILFQKAKHREPNNIGAIKFQTHYKMKEAKQKEKMASELACEDYRNVIRELKSVSKPDTEIVSRMVTAHSRISKLKGKVDVEFKIYKDFIEKRLMYYPEACYSQNACAEMADFFIQKDRLNDDEKKHMYRVFSRIRLSSDAEGYTAFSNFMDSSEFKRLNAVERGKILSILFPFYREIINIKRECRYLPRDMKENIVIPVHYTKVNTLTKLLAVKKEIDLPRLRLWNSAYMNDPHEGTCFWEMMNIKRKEVSAMPNKELTDENVNKDDIVKKNYFYMLDFDREQKDIKGASGNIYITSFSNKKDDLLMWIAYGDEAEGCNITFSDKFLDIKYAVNEMQDVSLYSDYDYPLYRVQYIDMKALKEKKIVIRNGEVSDREKEIRIETSIKEIWKYIDALEDLMDDENGEIKGEMKKASKELVVAFVLDALNEIRFLFKDDEFLHEDEMRVVQYAADPDYDFNFDVPRPYINLEREIEIEEVKLGAKINPQKRDEIETWLLSTGKVKKVTKSEKHYK